VPFVQKKYIYNPEEWSPSGDVFVGGMHSKPSQSNDIEMLIGTSEFSDVSVFKALFLITFLP